MVAWDIDILFGKARIDFASGKAHPIIQFFFTFSTVLSAMQSPYRPETGSATDYGQAARRSMCRSHEAARSNGGNSPST